MAHESFSIEYIRNNFKSSSIWQQSFQWFQSSRFYLSLSRIDFHFHYWIQIWNDAQEYLRTQLFRNQAQHRIIDSTDKYFMFNKPDVIESIIQDAIHQWRDHSGRAWFHFTRENKKKTVNNSVLFYKRYSFGLFNL